MINKARNIKPEFKKNLKLKNLKKREKQKKNEKQGEAIQEKTKKAKI
jgi:hypothetical protein